MTPNWKRGPPKGPISASAAARPESASAILALVFGATTGENGPPRTERLIESIRNTQAHFDDVVLERVTRTDNRSDENPDKLPAGRSRDAVQSLSRFEHHKVPIVVDSGTRVHRDWN